MNNYIPLSSLAMDLRRAADGYWRGSDKMAERFLQEALARKAEVDKQHVDKYIADLLESMDYLTNASDQKKIAQDLLLYSILFQNAALKLK